MRLRGPEFDIVIRCPSPLLVVTVTTVIILSVTEHTESPMIFDCTSQTEPDSTDTMTW